MTGARRIEARTAPLELADGTVVLPGNRWDLLAGRAPVRSPTVSVVVTYFAAQRHLDFILTALRRQSHPPELMEVIVADDGSPQAPDLRCAGSLRVRTVRQSDRGFRAAAVRNLGAAGAVGEVLCFLDGDTIPEPAYVRRMSRLPALAPDALVVGRRRHADLSGWSTDDVDAWLCGRGDAPPELTEPEWLQEAYGETRDLLELRPDSYRFVISSVLAVSRRLFAEVGGFEASMVGYGGEDWELAHRALAAGAVLAHEPTAVAWHDGPEWGRRGDEESRRREKNLETAALQALIASDPHGARVWTGFPAVIVELSIDGEERAAILVAVASLLAAGLDFGLWLRGPGAESLVQQAFARDPRVQAGPVDSSVRSRALVEARLTRPLRVLPAAWSRLVDAVTGSGGRPARVGEILVVTSDGRLIVTSAAARARAERWACRYPGADLIGTLFGRGGDSGEGVFAVPRRPSLPHELHHLLDR